MVEEHRRICQKFPPVLQKRQEQLVQPGRERQAQHRRTPLSTLTDDRNMSDQYPGFIKPDAAGAHGETLELCTPLPWPGLQDPSSAFVHDLIPRLVAASYRPPEFLGLFAIRKPTLTKLLVFAKEAISCEKNIVDIVVPPKGRVHVFGDTHGDLHSLVEGLFRVGWPSEENILCFAGDCVDRGSWGVEVFVILLALKLWNRKHVFLLRGNHETTGCVERYGFQKEVRRKYDDQIFQLFVKVFQELPCAAVIRNVPNRTGLSGRADVSSSNDKKGRKGGNRLKREAAFREGPASVPEGEEWRNAPVPGEVRILVVHGGLFRAWKSGKKGSMTLGNLTDLAEIRRQGADPIDNIIEDVLWSDPQIDANDVAPNILRGAGILYGRGAVEAFFKRNHLHGLIRAHEGPDMREKREGMDDMLKGYSLDIELVNGFVATVFSAAQYPPDNPRGNLAAYATVCGKEVKKTQLLPEFTQFEKKCVPQDFILFYETPDAEQAATPRTSIS